ncbi:pancreatic alpha-amylase, partial [Tachysurus ichikawai]
VIDLGGEPIKASDYYGLGRVTEFKYGAKLGTVFRKWNNEKLRYLVYVNTNRVLFNSLTSLCT